MPRLGRLIPLLLVLAASALLLAACGGGGDDDGGEAAGGVRSELTIGMNSPTYSTQMTTFVAIDEGFFAEEGIDEVEVVTSDDYVAGLVGGSLDITQGDTDALLIAAAKGAGVTLIGNYRAKEFQILAAGEGIDSVADLRGQTVTGGDRGGRNEAVVKQLLRANGVSPSEVELVPFGGGSDDRLQALLAGRVAATNLFPRHRDLVAAGGGRFLTEDLVDAPQESVATTDDFYASERATVDAYWRAILKARAFIAEEANADRVIEISRAADLEVIPEYEATFPEEVVQIRADGAFDVAAMDRLIDQEKELDLVPQDLQWREHFDFESLHQAQDALGIDRAPTPGQLGGGPQ